MGGPLGGHRPPRARPRQGRARGDPSSPPQALEPPVAGRGDPDLEAVDVGAPSRRSGVIKTMRTLTRRRPRSAGELSPEPVRFPGGTRAGSGSSPPPGQSSRVPANDDRQRESQDQDTTPTVGDVFLRLTRAAGRPRGRRHSRTPTVAARGATVRVRARCSRQRWRSMARPRAV